MTALLTLLLSSSYAADAGMGYALHALRDEWRATSNRATEDELAEEYERACQRGWQPACAPEAWRDAEGRPNREKLDAVLGPVCERGDPLACIALHAFVKSRLDDASLGAQCDAGFAPACTAVSRKLLVTGSRDEGLALLDAVCSRTLPADGPLPWDPAACRILGEMTGDLQALNRACTEGRDGRACAQWAALAGTPEDTAKRVRLACDGGDASSCLAVAASYDDEVETTDADGVPDPAGAAQRAARNAALVRACGLESAVGCTAAAMDQAQGRGVPVDLPAAHDGFWNACQLGDGAACVYLADAILDDRAEGFGLEPRELFKRACDLDDKAGCRNARMFDRKQGLRRRQLRRANSRVLPYFTVRPWLGGSAGITARIERPKVDAYASRRHLEILLDAGAFDFTMGSLDQRETEENVSSFAVDWQQVAVPESPWGVRLAAGTEYWQGAPRFSEDALLAEVPGEPAQTFDLNTVVLRADLERTGVRARSGVRGSLGTLSAWNTQNEGMPVGTVTRAVATVFQRPETPRPLTMRGAETELSFYAGITTGEGAEIDSGTVHGGVWFTDRRALPLLHARSGRDALSIVSDVAAGIRRGGVPFWLTHHHPAHFTPTLGSWQLLRGQPAALTQGETPIRARAGLRWWVTEYHGRPQHFALYLTPFVEAGTAVPDLTSPSRTRWRSDGGVSASLAWRRRTALHLEALLVSDLDNGGYDIAPSLVLSAMLEPWD